MGKIVHFSPDFLGFPHFIHNLRNIFHMGCLGPWLWYNIRMSNTKTILAGLLATENLSVVHDPAAETASFDLKNRVLTLPVWEKMSNSLYDMLVGHEVAHALHTPCDGWKDNIEELSSMHGLPYAHVQQYVNVVEDARIERLIKKQFPGLRRDFLDAYVDLMNRDLFSLDGRSMSDLSLIDRLNLEFKVGIHAGETIPFAPAEVQWIDRIKSADTFSDVLDIVNDLLASIIDDNEEQEQEQESTESESGDGEGEGSPESSDDSDDDSGEDQQQGSGSAGDDDTEDGADADSSPDSGDGASDEDSPAQQGASVPESITEQAFSKVSDAMRDGNSQNYDAREETLERVDLDRHIIDYKRFHRLLSTSLLVNEAKETSDRECRQFIVRSKPTVNVLVKQFEMKKQADQHKRVQISKSGVLDTVKMMNYKWSEDVFRKNATVREGKNHGLVMFLDWSGSMCDQITETMEQVMQLVLFCQKVNIPFEVYAFTSTMPHEFDKDRTEKEDNEAYENTHYRFALLNLFSSRMNKRELDAALPQCYALAKSQSYNSRTTVPCVGREFGLGGTPLNEAILAAIDIVPSFKKNNNVQIVNSVFLTDGSSNGMHVPYNGTLKIKGDRIGVQVNQKDATNLLTKMLQDRTGSKVVNFFLADWTPAKFERHSYYYFRDHDKMYAGLATWKSDNYAISSNDSQGWDEQYLIRTVQIDTSDAMGAVKDTDTTAKKKNAFLKSMRGRSTSRVVLNRFIDMIA